MPLAEKALGMIRGEYGDGHNNLTVTSVVVASAALAIKPGQRRAARLTRSGSLVSASVARIR